MLNSASTFSWITIPRIAGRISRGLFNTLTDGYYIIVFKPLASYINGIIFLAGLFIGILRPGFQYSFTESLLLLMLFFFIGALSGRLGFSLIAGFIIGISISHHKWRWYLHDYNSNGLFVSSFFLEFILIYIGVTQISLFVKNIVARSIDAKKMGKKALTIIIFLMYLILINGVVYLWTQTLPLFLRSILFWREETLLPKAFEPIQNQWMYICVAVSAAAIIRLWLQISTQTSVQSLEVLKNYEQNIFIDFKVNKPFFERIPLLLRNTLSALLVTFIATGLFLSIQDAFIYFIVMMAFYLLKNFLVQKSLLEKWNKILGIVPFTFRLFLAFVLSYVIIRALMPVFYKKVGMFTFWPVILSSFIGMIIYLLLIPPVKNEKA